MKRHLINLISVGWLSTLSVCSLSAQENSTQLPPLTVSVATTAAIVNAKVNKMFSQHFKNATILRWYEVDKKLLVKFIMNDQENRALFTKNGELVYHISIGTEASLPPDVRKLIKSNYYDQQITRVYKVNQHDRTVWISNMEDDSTHITVRVEDFELDEILHVTKSN